ncbi:MAG TPA: TIGR02281 family clan AA aspartic protease [Acetobacteraceae bacterium]|nr:TIGR02281 family clan AA aspartic protease [Acetobacteraceae bacterium]
MRYTLRVVAGSLVVTGLVAWLLVSHTPTPTGKTMPRAATGSSSTLFYHASNQMSFPRGRDGRYQIDAAINERAIRFVVDAGTPTVMLSRADARAAGIDIGKLSFSSKAVTPSGEMHVAPAIIPMFTLKQLTLFNVKAVVAEGTLSTSIIGLDFLKRFDSYDIGQDELVLRW